METTDKRKESPKWQRISHKKILRIKKIEEDLYENVQILHIEGDNINEVKNNLRFLSFDNFPNAFLITTHLNIDLENSEFFSLLIRNIGKSREFFLHINFDGNYKAFYKRKESDKFEMIITNEEKEIMLEKLKSPECCLSVASFFKILSFLGALIIEADFGRILNFLEPNFDEFSYLKKAIQDRNEQMVKFLALFLPDLSENTEILDDFMQMTIATGNCDIFLAFLNNSSCNLSNLQLEPAFKKQILLRTAESGNVKALKDLSNLLEKSLNDYQTWCQMRETASERNFHQFIFELQKMEDLFFELSKVNEELPNFHASIRNNNFGEVRNFVEKFPHFKICTFQNKSALEESIDSKSLFIYSYLLSEEFICQNQDVLDDEINQLDQNEKRQIQNFNHVYLKECPDKLINILASKCRFLSSSTKISAKETREMLENIKNIEGVQDMMKILIHSNVTIAKDLKNKYICTIYPNKRDVLGRAENASNVIYVGKNYSTEERGVTFVHEMTHYVLMLMYENKFLPYCAHDERREAEFDEIFQKVREVYENDKEGTHVIISSIFEGYEIEKQKEELIARVPHLLAFHQNNEVDLRAIEVKIPELFDFYRTKVLPEQQSNFYRTIKFNNDFGLIAKIEKFKYQINAQMDLNSLGNKILFTSKTPDLVLSKVANELKEYSLNKIAYKATNVFIDVIHVEQERFMWELTNLMEDFCVARIIVDVRKAEKDKIRKYIPAGIKCIAVTSENDKEIIETLRGSGFESLYMDIEWRDLFQASQELLLSKKIKFQSIKLTVRELFKEPQNSISSEVLAILCTKDEISINCEMSDENWDDFIPRKVLKKIEIPADERLPNGPKFEFSEFSTEHFIKDSRNEKNFASKIFISDPAGSGKTFLFKKISDEIKSGLSFEELSSHFILFFALKNHLGELKKGVGDNFVDFIAKIGKFDALTKAIFVEKYKAGETIIFFDAFDEISPKCERETKTLFKLFKACRKNQIFISTRTHLEEDLEREFNILAHKIKNLTDDEQILYLRKFWRKFNSDESFVEQSAIKLVTKITEIISTQPRLIGVPIIVKSLAEIFIEKIKNQVNFEDEIENLNIAEIYRKITIEKLLSASMIKYENQLFDYSKETASPIQMHIFIAVKHVFDEDLANNLVDRYNKSSFTLEEIARFGIVKYNEEGDIDFHHETNAEFLVAYLLFTILQNKSAVSKPHYVFFFKIVLTHKFALSRLFLDSMLEKIDNFEESMNFFNIEIMFCGYMRQNITCLNNIAQEGLFNFYDFLLSLMLFKKDVGSFNFFLSHKSLNGLTLFMEILQKTKKAHRISKFLDKVNEAHESFEQFVSQGLDDINTSNYGTNVIFLAIEKSKSLEIFELIWQKTFEYIQDADKIKEILLERKKLDKTNIYQHALGNNNDQRIFEFILNKTKNYFNNNETFEKFLFEMDDVYQNVITQAASSGHAKNIRILFNEIEERLGMAGLKRALEMKGGNYSKNLLSLALESNSRLSNEALWEIFEEHFSKDKIIAFIHERTAGKDFLYDASERFQPDVLEFLVGKIKFYIANFHEFMLRKNNDGKNILLQITEDASIQIFSYYLENVFCENFPCLGDFIYETDEKGDNFFHKVVIRSKIKMIEFALNFLKSKLPANEFEKFLNLRNEQKESILHVPTQRRDDSEAIDFLVNFIEKEFGQEILKSFLSMQDKSACVPLTKCLQPRYSFSLRVCIEIFLYFIPIYEKLFSRDEIENILKLKNQDFYQNALNSVRNMRNVNEEGRAGIFLEIMEKYNIRDFML